MKKYGILIIGAGAAGFAAALRVADFGVKIGIVNDGPLGGTCVNVGCVPSKFLIEISNKLFYSLNNNIDGLKFIINKFDFEKIISQKNKLVKKLRTEKYEKVLQEIDNTDFFEGRAKFINPHAIQVNDEVLYGDKIIIATGASPRILNVPGVDDIDILDNVKAMNLTKLPNSILIVGGRAQALEFAQMFRHFGSDVTIVQRSKRILPDAEPEISIKLKDYLEREGIRILTGSIPTKFEQRGDSIEVTIKQDEEIKKINVEKVLMATGRVPNTRFLGLENIGIELRADGSIKVNNQMETNIPYIFAAGDVKGKPMLETVAAREGFIAATNALSSDKLKIDYSIIPHAVFTTPQVASVGYTDKIANELGFTCRCSTVKFRHIPKALILFDERGLIKIVIDAKTERILGVHILSKNAADIIMEGVLAVKYNLTLDDIIETTHVFPTLSEALKIGALSFKRDIDKLSCCTV